jgi:hypothetical protein
MFYRHPPYFVDFLSHLRYGRAHQEEKIMNYSLVAQPTTLPVSPIEVVEAMMIRQDLAYDRPVEHEIVAETTGIWSTLKLWYCWEEEADVLIFTCALENRISKNKRAKIYPLLAAINEKMWLGHFDLTSEEGVILFRYSLLARDAGDVSLEMLSNVLDIATTECNRFYPALQAMLWSNKTAEQAIEIAMFETQGEA